MPLCQDALRNSSTSEIRAGVVFVNRSAPGSVTKGMLCSSAVNTDSLENVSVGAKHRLEANATVFGA